MPRVRPSNFIPKYRNHRPSGQAVVTLSGRDHYLGPHGTAASKRLYDRRVGEWIASGRRTLEAVPTDGGGRDLSITQLIAAYFAFAQGYYLKNGKPTSETHCIRLALQRLKDRYGNTPAREFTPLALKAVREVMIAQKLKRRVINGYVDRIRRCFRWAVAEELVPAALYHGLQAVAGLRAGRSEAVESVPVTPVADAIVEATLAELSPTVADMVRIQRLTGMRPGAVCRMTTGTIDTTGDVWFYIDGEHKTAHHGKRVRVGNSFVRSCLPQQYRCKQRVFRQTN